MNVNTNWYLFGFFAQLNVLSEIGGTRGNSDGSKVLEPVVHALIAPVFLPSISWSGRGRGKEIKISLSKYTRIINLIVETLNKSDRKFDHLKTTKDLKYRILKYAPAKFGQKEKDSEVLDCNNSTVNGTVSK